MSAAAESVSPAVVAMNHPAESINFPEGLPQTQKSAVLTEKLADLYWASKKLSDALETYAAVLKRNPSPQQRIRVLLTLAERRELYGPDAAAYALYEQFLKENPNYPDLLGVYQKMLPLAKRLPFRSAVAWAKDRWVAVGTSGSDVSQDDGDTWKPLDRENYNSVGFTSTGDGWAVGPKGRIAKFAK